ncbi:MAG: hypothetical protein WA896_17545, partial [Spirulinaceae cyanobacterium]
RRNNVSSYLLSVAIFTNSSEVAKTSSVMCEILPHQPLPTEMPSLENNRLICPDSYQSIYNW